jgi:hypothetical protein
MSKLEVQYGKVFLGDVYHRLPVVETILRKDLMVLSQLQSLQDLIQLRHVGTCRGRDRHDVADV